VDIAFVISSINIAVALSSVRVKWGIFIFFLVMNEILSVSCPGRAISVQSLGKVRSIWLNAYDHTFHVCTEMSIALAATYVH
jgi:hypothetical protein